MLNSCSSGGVENINEPDMQEVVKGYYRLCRQVSDKGTLIKDSTLIQSLPSLVTDQRPLIAVYATKILLALTDDAKDAKMLTECSDLMDQLKKALSDEDMAPRVLRKLLIVQTRLNNASSNNRNSENQPARKTIFGSSAVGSKQFVFSFEQPTEVQRRAIEQKCIASNGVISISFQNINEREMRCLVRCRHDVDAKTVAQLLLRAGEFELVSQLVRMPNGAYETFDFYADQLALEQDEAFTHNKHKQLPKYLDDLEVFDSDQCIATNEQIKAQQQSGGWLSSLKSMFW